MFSALRQQAQADGDRLGEQEIAAELKLHVPEVPHLHVKRGIG